VGEREHLFLIYLVIMIGWRKFPVSVISRSLSGKDPQINETNKCI
jgi:hypothetical protein